jgi:hypothetical protein
MKFTTLITSALALGSALSSAIPNSQPTESTGLQIRSIINSDSLYNIFQNLSKVPKDKLTQEIKKSVDEVQSLINVSYDFEQRVEHLDAQQSQQLIQLWGQVFEKLSKPLPHNLKELEQLFKPESLKLLEIVYKSNQKEKLEYVYKIFNDLHFDF